jgi:hypothetical protein
MITPIKTVFEADGFVFTQLVRQGQWAIYDKRRSNWTTTNNYEVVKVRVCKAREVMGKPYPDREIYPQPDQWGIYGFTEQSLPHAQARLASLLASQT